MGRCAAAVMAAAIACVCSSAPALAQLDRSVTIEDNSFEPGVARAEAGAVVVWANAGTNDHTVTADDGSFDSFTLAPGDTFSRVFSEPGTYRYHCSFHGASGGSGMSGVVRVGAVTGDDDDDAADGGAKPPVRRRERPARGLPQTGGEDVPPVGYVVAALAFVALGGWLRGWERIVRGGR